MPFGIAFVRWALRTAPTARPKKSVSGFAKALRSGYPSKKPRHAPASIVGTPAPSGIASIPHDRTKKKLGSEVVRPPVDHMKMTRMQRVLGNWVLWVMERFALLSAWIRSGRAGVIEMRAKIEQHRNQMRYRLGKSMSDTATPFDLYWEEQNKKREDEEK